MVRKVNILRLRVTIALFVLLGNAFGLHVSHDCFPLGLREPLLPIAYVQSASAVESIRLSDGSQIWTHATAGRPIALWDGRLAVQVPLRPRTFRVDVLDKATGVLVIQSQAISFPPGVEPSYSPYPISTSLSDHTLVLEWEVRSHYSGGANPPPDFVEPTRDMIMQAKMDLSTGRILTEVRDARDEGAGKVSIPPGVRYLRKGELSNAPWNIGSTSVGIVGRPDSPNLYLEISKEKSAHLRKEISRSRDLAGQTPYVSDDGKYIVLEVDRAGWAIYSAYDGHQIGKLTTSALADPCVVEDRLYYLSDDPQKPAVAAVSKLVAQDLKTGEVAWTETLGATHRGNRPKLPQ